MTGGLQRRLVVASAIAVVMTAAFLSGSSLGSSAAAVRRAQAIPAGLVAAIHAQFGAGAVRGSSPATEHPQMGYSVALSADGTTALVGTPLAGLGNGAVYIYHVASAESWVSSSTPTATLSGAGAEELGVSVALSADGTTAFVGAPGRAHDSGAVLVFHVADENSWASTSTPTATLTIDDGFAIGEAVAVSPDGMTLVVGDPFAGFIIGAAYVFHVSSEDAWASSSTPTATLSNAAQSNSDFVVADDVAISGDGTTVLLSNDFFHHEKGGAYLFHVASAAAWTSSSTPTAILSNASGVPGDDLGARVALSADGTTAFLGAPGVNGERGAVDVFHAADEGSWVSSSTPAAILTNAGGAEGDVLGAHLAVPADGTTVVTSAPGVHRLRGATYVFRASGEDAWTSSAVPTAALTDSAGARHGLLGASLASAADGATVLVGAPLVNWRTGKADVFHVADAGSWLTSSTPTALLTNAALPEPKCVVPRLLGYHRFLAREALSGANCRLGTVKRVHSIKRLRRRVVWQSRAPRSHLPPGSKINVRVGK